MLLNSTCFVRLRCVFKELSTILAKISGTGLFLFREKTIVFSKNFEISTTIGNLSQKIRLFSMFDEFCENLSLLLDIIGKSHENRRFFIIKLDISTKDTYCWYVLVELNEGYVMRLV